MAIEAELRDVLRARRPNVITFPARPQVCSSTACVTRRRSASRASNDPIAVDAQTLFQVASITKTFTSAAVMLLVEAGRVALDDPVARHLPDLGARTGLDTGAITVEHLLSHQAGFDGDHLFVGGFRADRRARPTRVACSHPGTGYSYNNAAFTIAGLVVESASGSPFDVFVRERLLVPLGMTQACFRADDAITRRVALPHVVLGDESFVIRYAGWQPGWELAPIDWAAGGLIASVDHLLAWARFQCDGTALDGSRVLTSESLTRLHTPVVTADRTEDVGLDWFVARHGAVTSISHSGVTAGYCSRLVVVPDRAPGRRLADALDERQVRQRRSAPVGARTLRRRRAHRPGARSVARRRHGAPRGAVPVAVRAAHRGAGCRAGDHPRRGRATHRRRRVQAAARPADHLRVLRAGSRGQPRLARPDARRSCGSIWAPNPARIGCSGAGGAPRARPAEPKEPLMLVGPVLRLIHGFAPCVLFIAR